MKMDSEMIKLKIRNLLADKEFETALANRELNMGDWLSDHKTAYWWIDAEIQKLWKELAKMEENA